MLVKSLVIQIYLKLIAEALRTYINRSSYLILCGINQKCVSEEVVCLFFLLLGARQEDLWVQFLFVLVSNTRPSALEMVG